MVADRAGQELWLEWEGEDFPADDNASVIYYTVGQVDLDHDIVRRALAAQLQRSGIADSLGNAYKILEHSHVKHGWLAFLDESDYPTFLVGPDDLIEIHPGSDFTWLDEATWVELNLGDY